MTPRPIRLLLGFLTVGMWTMASRVLGFVRDILIAALLGAGPVAEAFFVALRLPNMFRRFFAEGAFNTAFVPLFSKRLEAEGPDAARAFGTEAMSGLVSVLVLFTLAAQAIMPWMVWVLAGGFEDGPKFDLTVILARIMFPYILFISLAALLSGVLNAFGRFAAAAAAPVLLNVILISAMGLVWLIGLEPGRTLAWAVALAGIAQCALVWRAARRIGMGLVPRRPVWTPDMARLVQLGIPALLAGGVMQINLVVGTRVASEFEGAVAWLSYADRVYQLPLGVVGVAIGIVLLPELSRRLRAGDLPGTREAMNRAAEFSLALTLPATAGLLAIPVLISAVLFERGAFRPEDTAATAQALTVYALGLPAFVLQKVVQPAYFAREDTRSPLRFALVGMAVNLVVAVALAPLIGFIAAAIATTLAAWVNLWLLVRGLPRLDERLAMDARLAARLPRLILAAAAMGLAVWGMAEAAAALLPGYRVLALACILPLALILYGAVAAASGAFRPADLTAALRRKPTGQGTSGGTDKGAGE